MKRTKYYRPANRDYMIRKTNLTSEIAMLVIAAAILFSGCQAKACDGVYLKVGAGYKFAEADKFTIKGKDYDKDYSPISARFELGISRGNVTYGLSHDSQWLTGWPISNEKEYSKSEVFIDYKFRLGGS